MKDHYRIKKLNGRIQQIDLAIRKHEKKLENLRKEKDDLQGVLDELKEVNP